jgi:hypothetical protein
MFKKTDPQQSLFGIDTQLSDGLQTRLRASWAHLFRVEILPILFRCEDKFSVLYGETGRPNFSVARLVGTCPLLVRVANAMEMPSLLIFKFLLHSKALWISGQPEF